jgi:hypothetical protein
MTTDLSATPALGAPAQDSNNHVLSLQLTPAASRQLRVVGAT